MRARLTAAVTVALTCAKTSAATAAELPIVGQPVAGGTGLQPAVTELARDVRMLDNFLLFVITGISLFVGGLLLWLIVRFNKRASTQPAHFTHNTRLEVAWTLIPVLILIVIGAVSLPVLFRQQTIPPADVHIKVTGFQWYWGYEYTDTDVGFESFMLEREQLAAHGYSDDQYLLATDTAVVIPTGRNIVMSVTGADVIHSWALPSFGVKQDGIPGRLAQLWFKVDEGREGIYFGQCSELCGLNHAYMPITVMAVSPSDYDAWMTRAQKGDVSPPAQPVRIARQ